MAWHRVGTGVATVAVAAALLWGQTGGGAEPAELAAIEPDPPGFEVFNTQNPDDIPTPAERSLAQMEVAEGFQLTQFAAEPHVRQPIAFTLDDRGRLWVIENYSYPAWGSDEHRDRVLILEDTTADGRMDTRRIFLEGGKNLTGIALGFGGVWLCSTPEIIFIPIDEETDQPAGAPMVVLDGFDDGPVGHNVVNGLTWGPDGWLYGRHGIQAPSHVGPPGTPDEQRVTLNCSIWRYHPTRELFEVVAHGTTNPWGFDFDDHGHMFFTNNVNGHLFHLLPGARYQRMYGSDYNPHVYELLPPSKDHQHYHGSWTDARGEPTGALDERQDELGGGHSHVGAMIYLGDNWPEQFRNNIFMFNTHGRRINQDRLVRNGAGYIAAHGEDILHANDPWFRGLALKYGPDGGVFFTDWNQFGECHDHDGVYRDSGRIYKLTWGDVEPATDVNVAALSNAELVDLQLHQNDWYVRHARRVLQERAADEQDMSETHAALRRMFDDQADDTRQLRAMWALHVTGGADSAWLTQQLDHDSEHVRVWAVRLLVDHRDAPAEAIDRMADRAAAEPSSLVRLHLASAMQWMGVDQRLPLATALAAGDDLADDDVFPLMLWYSVEPAVTADADFGVDLAVEAALPKVRRFAARRIATAADQQPRMLADLVARLATLDDATRQADLAAGLHAGLRGRAQFAAPDAWSDAYAALADHPDPAIRQEADALAAIFGDGQAIVQLYDLAQDSDAPVHARRQALDTLIEQEADDVDTLLRGMLRERGGMRLEAIAALAAAPQNIELAQMVRDRLEDGRLPHTARQAAVDTLTSRPAYARLLLDEVEAGRIDADVVSLYHARRMLAMESDGIGDRVRQFWPAIVGGDVDWQQQLAEYQEMLAAADLTQADAEAGQTLFAQRCSQCHQLYGEGGAIGGDLTGSDRTHAFLLLKILAPQAAVPVDQRLTIVHADDGRVLTGVVANRTDDTLTLRMPSGDVLLNRDHIRSEEQVQESVMPRGLIHDLDDDELINLFGYLTGEALTD